MFASYTSECTVGYKGFFTCMSFELRSGVEVNVSVGFLPVPRARLTKFSAYDALPRVGRATLRLNCYVIFVLNGLIVTT